MKTRGLCRGSLWLTTVSGLFVSVSGRGRDQSLQYAVCARYGYAKPSPCWYGGRRPPVSSALIHKTALQPTPITHRDHTYRLKQCRPYRVTLREGDVLYMPAYWHHEVCVARECVNFCVPCTYKKRRTFSFYCHSLETSWARKTFVAWRLLS